MIIKEIEMYNFRQYVGKQNIEFSTDKEKKRHGFDWCKHFRKNDNHQGV